MNKEDFNKFCIASREETFTCKTPPELEIAEENDGVTLILGQLNNRIINYWKIDEEIFDYDLGDYAIVENCRGYDLVKIVGIVATDEEYESILTNSSKIKPVVYVISKEELGVEK